MPVLSLQPCKRKGLLALYSFFWGPSLIATRVYRNDAETLLPSCSKEKMHRGERKSPATGFKMLTSACQLLILWHEPYYNANITLMNYPRSTISTCIKSLQLCIKGWLIGDLLLTKGLALLVISSIHGYFFNDRFLILSHNPTEVSRSLGTY